MPTYVVLKVENGVETERYNGTDLATAQAMRETICSELESTPEWTLTRVQDFYTISGDNAWCELREE